MISNQLKQECNNRLIELRAELINQSARVKNEYEKQDHGKDEADQTMAILAEKQFLTTQHRIRIKLQEIELALARIANGSYGVCEETYEPIEERRLISIPWTRLSIEGAEIREQSFKRRIAQ